MAGIDWRELYKRDSVSIFVDRLVREQDEHQNLLLALLVDVASMEDFPRLRRAEGAETKIAEARAAVARLRALVKPYEETLLARQRERERIDAAKVAAAERRATTQRLTELMGRYVELVQMSPQQRGFALEGLLRDLFDTFDLDPRASFRVIGEQIDGGFTIDNIHFVLEAKWEKAPADRAALDTFNSKVERRSDITQGLFVAIEGFEPTAVELHSRRRSPLILMDGGDLYAVLDGRIDLRELLRRKLRHAAMTGDILYTASEILSGS
ncbi:MAG: restriction endonuclease [Solirubrobacteraceae bacterium]